MPRTEYAKLTDKINNYIQTVDVILALKTYFQDKVKIFCNGRKMHTSMSNVISPDIDVTPDILAQINDGYGVVGEVKTSILNNEDLEDTEEAKILKNRKLKDISEQLKKYDDDLSGWTTPNGKIRLHDILLLIKERAISRDLREINGYVQSNTRFSLQKKSIFAHWSYIAESIPYYFIRKEKGDFSDECTDRIKNDFYDGITIYREKMPIGAIKFYDVEPEPEYLLAVIWHHIISGRISPEEYQNNLFGKRIIPIHVNIQDLTNEINEKFHPWRDPEITHPQVKKSWVKKAIDKLCEFNLAELRDGENYIIKFHRISTREVDVIDYFIKKSTGVFIEDERGQRSLDEFTQQSV